MTSSRSYLRDADEIFARADVIECWPRAAALVIRQALEAAVAELLTAEHGAFIERPDFTAQLIALRDVVDAELAREAAWAWSALSSATHAHAYGIGATRGELMRWRATAEKLTMRAG